MQEIPIHNFHLNTYTKDKNISDKSIFIKTYSLNIVAITSFPYAIRSLTSDIRYSIPCRVNGMQLFKTRRLLATGDRTNDGHLLSDVSINEQPETLIHVNINYLFMGNY